MAGGDGAAIIVASPARVSDPRFLTILAARTKRRAFSLANQTEPAHVRAANVAGLFGSPIRFQIRIVTCLRDSGGDGEPTVVAGMRVSKLAGHSLSKPLAVDLGIGIVWIVEVSSIDPQPRDCPLWYVNRLQWLSQDWKEQLLAAPVREAAD